MIYQKHNTICRLTPSPGNYSTAYINEQQFRYFNKVEKNRASNIYRIFITGGSVAFGSGSPNDSLTISNILERKLNKIFKHHKFEVINAATPAWTTTQERIWISNKLINYEPNLIISLSGRNDVAFQIENGIDILDYKSMWDHMFNLLIKNLYSTNSSLKYNDILRDNFYSEKKIIRNFKHNISIIDFLSKQYNFKYCYILQPSISVDQKKKSNFEKEIYNERDNNDYNEKFKSAYMKLDSVLNAMESRNFYYFNFSNCFSNQKKQIYIDECHFGDRGNKIVANLIANSLVEIINEETNN